MRKKCFILTILILVVFISICFAENVTIKSSFDDKDGNPLILPAILKKPNGKGPFRAGISFYPYGTKPLDNLNAPLMIIHGENDKWTPAETCTEKMPSEKTKHEVIHYIYPDANHDFDWPGLDETFEGQRLVYNPAAAKLAIKDVKAFLTIHLRL